MSLGDWLEEAFRGNFRTRASRYAGFEEQRQQVDVERAAEAKERELERREVGEWEEI